MRRAVVASLVGLVALTVAAPAAAEPGENVPITMSGLSETDAVLQAQGFGTPKVFYRIGDTQEVRVVYDGGGPADQLEAIRQIELTVWGHEHFSFDQLVIQNGSQPPFAVSYADLQMQLGPRPQGLGEQPLATALAIDASMRAYERGFTRLLDVIKVAAIAIGVVTLLAVLAFGLASFLGTRRHVPEESEHRLVA